MLMPWEYNFSKYLLTGFPLAPAGPGLPDKPGGPLAPGNPCPPGAPA